MIHLHLQLLLKYEQSLQTKYVVLNQEREAKGVDFYSVLMRVGHKNLSAANDVMIVTNDPVLQARLMKPSC